MAWSSPIPLRLVPSGESESFKNMKADETALPLLPHPGAFGAVRKHHIHEGIDLYCPEGTIVSAVEDGTVVARFPFTGPQAGSPWWNDTEAVLIEGKSGVIVYGEIALGPEIEVGKIIKKDNKLGNIIQVLKEDKGRPLSMLHLELHMSGTRDAYEWKVGEERPPSLRDPTSFLMEAVIRGGDSAT